MCLLSGHVRLYRMYYELTYNGNKDEIYFDAYRKVENICIELCGK